MPDDNVLVSDETRRRVDTARVRDFAFYIKKHVPQFDDTRAEALAQVLIEAADKKIKATSDFALKRLMEMGFPREEAEQISNVLPTA